MAFRLLVRAQELKVTDPASAFQLQEEVIRILINEILERNKALRILRRLLLRTINEEELRDGEFRQRVCSRFRSVSRRRQSYYFGLADRVYCRTLLVSRLSWLAINYLPFCSSTQASNFSLVCSRRRCSEKTSKMNSTGSDGFFSRLKEPAQFVQDERFLSKFYRPQKERYLSKVRCFLHPQG